MFEKSLTDLIKGIRANPPGEADFISTCMAECRTELQSVEASTKQMAVVKLTYLQMLGHDVSWAAFHFVEVMAAPRFRGKRIGFLGDQTLYSLMTVAPAANGTGDGRGLFHALPCGWNRQTGTHMAGWPGFWAAHACQERCGLLHFNFAGHKVLAEALKAEAAAGGEWRAACRAVFDRARRTDPLFRNGSADARMLGEVSGCCVAE